MLQNDTSKRARFQQFNARAAPLYLSSGSFELLNVLIETSTSDYTLVWNGTNWIVDGDEIVSDEPEPFGLEQAGTPAPSPTTALGDAAQLQCNARRGNQTKPAPPIDPDDSTVFVPS